MVRPVAGYSTKQLGACAHLNKFACLKAMFAAGVESGNPQLLLVSGSCIRLYTCQAEGCQHTILVLRYLGGYIRLVNIHPFGFECKCLLHLQLLPVCFAHAELFTFTKSETAPSLNRRSHVQLLLPISHSIHYMGLLHLD